MVNEHQRYIRDQESKRDKGQAKFDGHGWLSVPEPPKVDYLNTANMSESVACPFCLYTAKLSLFLVSTQKGISQSKAQCPECKNTMMMKSLWNDWGAKEYAEWVFAYRQSGFWKKCPFEVWKKRLHSIGWAHEFWTRYKALKGDALSDDILDGSGRTAEEYDKAAAEYEASQT